MGTTASYSVSIGSEARGDEEVDENEDEEEMQNHIVAAREDLILFEMFNEYVDTGYRLIPPGYNAIIEKEIKDYNTQNPTICTSLEIKLF